MSVGLIVAVVAALLDDSADDPEFGDEALSTGHLVATYGIFSVISLASFGALLAPGERWQEEEIPAAGEAGPSWGARVSLSRRF